ncbi:MAG: hypothetical protein ACFCUG_00960 [Thiotrichales bacterium]
MVQPVDLADFFIVFFSAAMVILAGALYALLFAWSKVKARPGFMVGAYLSYAVLFGSVLILAEAANLNTTFWQIVVGLMLLGYWWAPHAIFHLCVATHAHESESN